MHDWLIDYEVTLIGLSIAPLRTIAARLAGTDVGEASEGLVTKVLICTVAHQGDGRSMAVHVGQVIADYSPLEPVTFSTRRSPS